MSPQIDRKWNDYSRPFGEIGPLMNAGDILAENDMAGFRFYDAQQKPALKAMATYVTDFLPRPHADLGRDGNVCPFVPVALTKGFVKIASTLASARSVEAEMAAMLEVFREMPPAKPAEEMTGDWVYKAIIIAFPAVPLGQAGEIIGGLQKRLKPDFIRAGFMIGEFFPGCPEPGLHNEEFRPLQTPVPALAIRHITKYDAPFMLGSDEYLEGYFDIFGSEGRRRVKQLMTKKAFTCPRADLGKI